MRLARGESALKLRVGELLDALFLRGGHHELGFSSIDAYVVERCQRSAAWGRETRGLARRIRERSLVGLRRAVLDGALGSAMAELVARYATPELEASLLARAKESTVRALAAELGGEPDARGGDDERAGDDVSAIEWVRPADLAAVTASRMLVEYLTNGARSDEAFVEALLGEGQSALMSIAEGRRGAAEATASRESFDARLARALGAIAGRDDVHVASAACDARAPSGHRADDDDAGAQTEGIEARGPAATDDTSARASRRDVNFATEASSAVSRACAAPGDASDADGERTGSRRRARRDRLSFASPWGRSDFGTGRGPLRSFGGRGDASPAGPSLDALLATTKAWLDELTEEAPLPSTVRGLDAAIVRQCRGLARRGLAVARLLTRVARSGVWRTLGFTNVAHWAEERLGMSRSSLEHRMTLVKRLGRSPALERAVETGDVGYASALLVSRVVGRTAEEGLAEAWIDRAKRRTYKHLREEVRAVELARAYDADVSALPPSEEDLEAVADFERKVQSGEVVRPYALAGVIAPQTSVGLVDGTVERSEDAVDPAAAAVALPVPSLDPDSPAAVLRDARPMQLRISTDLFAEWRRVEAEYLALGGERRTFVPFLCAALWDAWLPFLETWDDKWKEVFRRDLHRCTSPVCSRHDMTAHHVRFRAHGGGDTLDNLTSGCAFCHLEGIHKGRLQAEGRAPRLTWTIGREPILRIRGREKVELGAAS
ncbi:HNH endonuclease [Myxococcota bacterium]|nr:HNH endonuclease [Myxococcota bacterium]